MTQLKRSKNSISDASMTRLEMERLVAEIRERVSQAPDKAAKILSSWTKADGKKTKTQIKKSA